jgi:hypothetical protein
MTRKDIITKIRKRMDEWSPFDDAAMLLGANEAMQPVGYQIEEVLDGCTDFILKNAPLRCVRSVDLSPLPVAAVTDGVGYVVLPDDFLRLNRVWFDDWINPVQRFVEYDSRLAVLQRFPWTRGGRRKPVCVLNANGDGKVLECYSTGGGLLELVYVPSLHFDDADKRVMDDDAIDLLLSYVAATVYNRMNEVEAEKIALTAYQQSEQRIMLQG